MPHAPTAPGSASVQAIIEGLLLFDEAILNQKYHEVLHRDPDRERRARLADLPDKVVHSHQLARQAAAEWGRLRNTLDPDFIAEGERVILESFLNLAESELRLISFMRRNAPTRMTRRPFDEMAEIQRGVCEVLRDVLSSTPPARPLYPLASVQEENHTGDLRGQLETAIRARHERGTSNRRVILSAAAHRHLRDQGCFNLGDTTILGVPVAVDLSWDTPAFALQGYDIVPLEELRNE